MSTATWERRECVSAEVEDSLVLLDLESLKYHSLNTTAAAVWEMLSEPRTEDSIVELLCQRYNVSHEQCRVSVDRLLDTLSASGLIMRSRTPAETAR